MSVLGYGRDEMLAVFLAKTYCLPILLYGCETWRMSSSDKHKLDVAWNNCFRKMFNACWRESAKPLLFYYGTMPVSLLVDQRKMIFLIIRLYAAPTLSWQSFADCICMRPDCFQSIMCFCMGYTGNVDIKRAVWARFIYSVFWFWFYCFSFNFSFLYLCIFFILYCCVFLFLYCNMA